MSNNIPPRFENAETETTNDPSTLKRHGLNINLSENLAKEFATVTLFDGDDGLYKELIKNTKIYYEYGCGKSTEYVFKCTDASVFAVDTSEAWAQKVKALGNAGNPERLNITWVDVGTIGDWGYPTSFHMRHNFRKYAECFWLKERTPDLVLIDGRFRVLCFLTTIKLAPLGTKILFDDYSNRPLYHVVEEISTRLDTCGRQALFEVTQTAKEHVNDDLLLSFQNVIS